MDQVIKTENDTLQKIWLSSPHMGGNELKYIEQAFEENWIAPLGPNVTGFEADLENYLQHEKKVAVLSSGTAALHLALIMAGVEKGDEVLCQSLTFAASANPIAYQGATPIFIDSEAETLNLSPVFLEEAIKDRLNKGKKPKAIVGVHLYGMPYKIEEVREISRKYDIPVIEDSAEALGSTYKGRKCGTFGDYAILSFNGNKIITTSGGGALVANSSQAKQKAVFLATQARDQAPHYQHSEIGYNYRMSNVCAGIGRGQMEVLDAHVRKRRAMHSFYKELFEGVEGIRLFTEPDSDFFSNNWLSVIELDPKKCRGLNREDLRIHLEKKNIESRPLWKPMHMQPVYQEFPFYGDGTSAKAFENSMCLPSGSNLGAEEKVRIADAIEDFLGKIKPSNRK